MVQHFTMQSVREIREALGMNRRQLAEAVCASIRSVINWETGSSIPDHARRRLMRNLLRNRGLTKRTTGAIPVCKYDPVKMSRYLGRPRDAGLDWSRMNWQQRNAWWGQRARYQRMQQRMQAGLVLGVPIAQPIVRLLDSAPDLAVS